MKRWLLVLVMTAGALLRLPLLDVRPMHTDEAVHAVKFGVLLESGEYRYDRHEYHGPTLYYCTLLPASIAGQNHYRDLTEWTLRIVPAVLGILLLLLLPTLPDTGKPSFVMAALFTALSPAMVYYSRYYIQENLLVCFSFALILSGHRMLRTGRWGWAIAAGFCVGLVHATKETSLIVFGVMAVSLLLTWLVCRRSTRPLLFPTWRNVLVLLGTAVITSATLFSSFGSHWQGIADSVLTYETYFARAGANAGHEQPWYYYVQLLGWWRSGNGPIWSEGPVFLFGIVGIVASIRPGRSAGPRRRVLLFFAFYALLMWIVYSAIPYKTPWTILGAYHGLIVMAGAGAAWVMDWMRERRLRWLGMALCCGAAVFLSWEAYRAVFVLEDDPETPYVYSHPGKDVKVIAEKVERLVADSPAGDGVAVQVLYPGDEYWPLPWYFRRLPRVGWWNDVGREFTPTPVILAAPELEKPLLRRLYDEPPPGERTLYVPLFDRPVYLRPGKEIKGYVTLELSQRLQEGALQ